MNSDRDFEQVAAEWLDTGSDWTPPNVVEAVLLAVRTTPQERDFRIPWRTIPMRLPMYAAAAVVILVFAGLAAYSVFGPGPNVGSGPAPSPTTQSTPMTSPHTAGPTTTPTAAPSPAATYNASAIDTSTWVTYTSDRYGFDIGHPPDWTPVPATRDWTMTDDASNWLSPAHEAFTAPGRAVRVSAWSTHVDRETTPETTAGVEAWVEDYCERLGNTPCTGIIDRAVPLCVELRDCHPGLLVPFEEDVHAFFTGGLYPDEMVVVAVWWPESASAVAQYGGSQRLLEAFLSTMEVWTLPARDAHFDEGGRLIGTPSP